jgi:hypothetical protein
VFGRACAHRNDKRGKNGLSAAGAEAVIPMAPDHGGMKIGSHQCDAGKREWFLLRCIQLTIFSCPVHEKKAPPEWGLDQPKIPDV